MQCTVTPPSKAARRAPLRLVERVEPPEQTPPESAQSCCSTVGVNFCRCWMPAWFALAEIVAQERRAASFASPQP